jgi:hypothetical protein
VLGVTASAVQRPEAAAEGAAPARRRRGWRLIGVGAVILGLAAAGLGVVEWNKWRDVGLHRIRYGRGS